jgi:predicted component of type VI protein secretion system
MLTPNGRRGTNLQHWLVPLRGGLPLEITPPILLLGRSEECDVPLEDESVSEVHCVIVQTDGLLLLRDLASRNGTRVNGQRVRRAALLPNDELQIGRLRFRVDYVAK